MKKRYPNLRKQLVILGFCFQVCAVSEASAMLRGYYGTAANLRQLAPTALPTGEVIKYGVDSISRDGANMTVHQNEPAAVIHWQTFNIGSQASVYFDQQSQSYKVLNRVVGDGYSQIYGKLSARGQVYLLNQNGILFGPGSQVNVHTLVASSLNMDENDYIHTRINQDTGLEEQYVEFPRFSAAGREYYYHDPAHDRATVSNQGAITTATGGSVFLIGSDVENHGVIDAPSGQVALAAGASVELRQFEEGSEYPVVPVGTLKVTASGADVESTATNFAGAGITADRGLAGMYGSFVNQEGLIRSVTALEANGNIQLHASYRVTTGKNSVTTTPVYSAYNLLSGEDTGKDSQTPTPLVPEKEDKQSPLDEIFDDRIITDKEVVGKISIKAEQGSIEHRGAIVAPGGDVTLTARDRVYLENGSSIDVSGAWVELPGDDQVIEVQLNSKELRDSFIYKDGPLHGEKVQLHTITGLKIADISDYLAAQPQSALERTVNGGQITLEATGDNGEVVVKEQARLDFGGGGRIYGKGVIEDTPVRIGNRIYSLNDVPEGMPIDEVLGYHELKHERWGTTDEWHGLYYGGSIPLRRSLPAFKQGGDAGRLTIKARKVVLDGILNAGVLRGIYQDMLQDPADVNGSVLAAGRRIPVAGALIIGKGVDLSGKTDFITDDIVISKRSVKGEEVSFADPLPDREEVIRTSYISSDTLNAANLGEIKLYANTRVVIADDAALELPNPASATSGAIRGTIGAAAGGRFAAQAKSVEHYGSISAPGGEVVLSLGRSSRQDLTDSREWQAVGNQVHLARGSKIDVSGAEVDNSRASGRAERDFRITGGGTVRLNEETGFANGVVVARGAEVDVGGGYEITTTGRVKGGDGGTFEATGSAVVLDGDIRGQALPDGEGGTIRLHADEVTVVKQGSDKLHALPDDFAASDDLPDDMTGRLVLAENRLQGTGFSHIELKSRNDLTVEKGVTITPSYTRRKKPLAAALRGLGTGSPYLEVPPEYGGPSSVTLAAGEERANKEHDILKGNLLLEQDSAITVAPKGDIALSTASDEGVARVEGRLTARSGTVTVEGSNVILARGGVIDATGATLPDPESTVPGLAENRSVLDAGSVTLKATSAVVLEQGSLVDVSGSALVTNTVPDGSGGFVQVRDASAPGSVSVEYNTDFVRDGKLLAHGHMDGLPGGSFTESKTHFQNGLTITSQDIDAYQAAGFDDLGFASQKSLTFDGVMDRRVGRRLTLNAPELIGNNTDRIALSAPWLRLWNMEPDTFTDSKRVIAYNGADIPVGTAGLQLIGDFIDVQGDVALTGFEETVLRADQALRFYDYSYSKTGYAKWSGALRTGADVTLQAPVIYPASHHHPDDFKAGQTVHNVIPTDFTIKTPGKVTILPGNRENRQPIHSAGGSLTIDAGDIEHRGELAAPLGTVKLQAKNRILMAAGSRITTRGEGAALLGKLDSENWQVYDKAVASGDPWMPIDGAPGKSVNISGTDVIQAAGADIDAGGGGSIYAYEFLPSFDGTDNPLAKEDRFVIMADNSVTLPGEAVYLEGIDGLPAGTYSKLPAEYAFLPGAMVIEKTGTAMLPGEQFLTPVGYAVVAGYETVAGTNITAATRHGYIVRDAAEVLRLEGNFDVKEIVAGNAGRVDIKGKTTILRGTIAGDALPGYKGASIGLSAAEIEIGNGFDSLLDGINLNDFNAALPENLQGKLFLDTDLVENRGVRELTVGAADTTDTITLLAGTRLTTVPRVTLTGKEGSGAIILEDGAEIHAVGSDADETGEIVLNAFTVAAHENSTLHASDLLRFNVKNLSQDSFQADIAVDHGLLGFSGDVIYLEPAAYSGARGDGLYLSNELLQEFDAIDAVELKSKTDLAFLGDVDLGAKKDLTLDMARMAVASDGASPHQVTINARNITFKNSSGNASAASAKETNTLRVAADTITFAGDDDKLDNSGDLLFDSFSAISFASIGDTAFSGQGALAAGLDSGEKMAFSAARFVSVMTPEARLENGEEKLVFVAGDYTVDAGPGDLDFKGNGNSGSSRTAMPGTLTFKGDNIGLDQALFDLPSGGLDFQAENNITVGGSTILARGEAFSNIGLDGGLVSMESAKGKISIDSGSLIDVSAIEGQKGGGIGLYAAVGGVTLDGAVKGDVFGMETNRIDDFGKLADTLAAGGFEQRVELKAREGDVAIGADDSVTTRNFKLTADGGRIDIFGKVDASAVEGGGTIEMYAMNDLTLQQSGRLKARGTDENADGGSILLSSEAGIVATLAGVESDPEYGDVPVEDQIDVSGGKYGKGGRVIYRVSEDNLTAARPDARVFGAASTIMLPAWSKDDGYVTGTDVKSEIDKAQTFLNSKAVKDWHQHYADLDLMPEITFKSQGNMSLGSGLNQLSSYRVNGQAGVLRFRSAGILTVTSDIIDSPSSGFIAGVKNPVADNVKDSWGLDFVAGADLTSADVMAVEHGGLGNFTVAKDKHIFTESADIRFASAGDTIINAASTAGGSMPGTNYYNIGTFDGSVSGRVGGTLDMSKGGVIETGIGDIDIQVAGNVLLGGNYSTAPRGAIRTVGRMPLKEELPLWMQQNLSAPVIQEWWRTRYWDYRDGGSIMLTAGGDITGYVNTRGKGWDTVSKEHDADITASGISLTEIDRWSASYGGGKDAVQGIATLAGGSIAVKAGGNLYSQVGAFGRGDLSIDTGGELNGRFMAMSGTATLTARGNFGSYFADDLNITKQQTHIEIGDTQLTVAALGNIDIGTVNNPEFTTGLRLTNNITTGEKKSWTNITYSKEASLGVISAFGDISVSGANKLADVEQNARLLPATVSMAAGRDIRFSALDFTMAPAASGTLTLFAGRDISGQHQGSTAFENSKLIMSDMDPDQVYGEQAKENRPLLDRVKDLHDPDVLHRNDPVGVEVKASRDIEHLELTLAKRAEVVAGRDIREINYKGQNVLAGDVSQVSAGRDIDQLLSAGYASSTKLGIEQAGPGFLLVQAGNAMDLGRSDGINTVGAQYNPSLNAQVSAFEKAKGSDLAVIVGYDLKPTQDELEEFFSELKVKGAEFSRLMATGDKADESAAARIKEEMLSSVINVLLDGKKSGSGDIRMVDSRIRTASSEDTIHILSAGKFDVGTTVLNVDGADSNTNGIMTEGGGDINILTQGDINVNESRVVTYFGGDIFMLSNTGNINAGRGAKTAVGGATSKGVNREKNGKLVPIFSAPGVGSGVRTLTYDPDGPLALTKPEQGVAYLIAWEGVIDAGEAGIAARDVLLAATEVINAQNISFSNSGVGVPVTGDAGPSLGALAGATTVDASQQAVESVGEMVSSSGEDLAKAMAKVAESLNVKLVVVKFVGFEGEKISIQKGGADGSF